MKYLLTLFSIILYSISLFANPPHPDLLRRIQSGEVPMPYYMQHEAEMNAGQYDSFDPLASPNPRTSLDEVEYNLLVLCVDFSDNVGTVEPAFFDSLVFDTTYGTVNNFYGEISYGNFTYTSLHSATDFGWIRAPETYAYYVNGQNGTGEYPQNTQKLAEDILTMIDPDVDFNNYDNDSDGTVDGIYIFHAGPEAGITGSDDDIWSHMWWTNDNIELDGISSFNFGFGPEYLYSFGDMTIGTPVHELGHLTMVLPDLYDRDYSSNGVGDWSFMAHGMWNGINGSSPAHPDAALRVYMGLVDPIIITENSYDVEIPCVNSSPTVYVLWTDGDISGQEYFLVENRGFEGYDLFIPGEGLLIWHFDMAQAEYWNDNEWYPGHEDSGHYLVALEQADGRWDLEHDRNLGDESDPWPGERVRRNFTSGTTPSSNNYDGTLTSVAVRNISDPGMVMTADLLIDFVSGADESNKSVVTSYELVSTIPNPFNPSTTVTIALPINSNLEVNVFNMMGQKVVSLANGQYSQGYHSFMFDGSGVASGTYYIQAVVPGKMDQVQKVTLTK